MKLLLKMWLVPLILIVAIKIIGRLKKVLKKIFSKNFRKKLSMYENADSATKKINESLKFWMCSFTPIINYIVLVVGFATLFTPSDVTLEFLIEQGRYRKKEMNEVEE